MPKLNFLDYVGKSLSKDRAREMCKRMELCELDTRLILERFCSGYENKTIEQCGEFFPVDQQKTALPHLIRKVRGWIQHNTGYFCLEELEGMAMYNLVKNKDKTLIEKVRDS